MTFKLKGCPRCNGGDLSREEDQFGPYLTCLQCGFLQDLPLNPATAAPKREGLDTKPGHSPGHFLPGGYQAS